MSLSDDVRVLIIREADKLPSNESGLLPAVSRFALCTMRQMRDFWRYSVPVTINNPKQVNIAADGGQQVNVQKQTNTKSRK